MTGLIDPRKVPVRFSALKQMSRSALHYWHACQRQTAQTKAQSVGSGTHAMVFGQPYAVWTERRAGAEWKAFQAANADRPILNEAEHATAMAMYGAIQTHPLAARLLLDPDNTFEQTINWSRNGRACRGTPDAFGNGALIDLKTTKCAEPEKFMRDAKWYGYHGQLAWYQEGLRELGVQCDQLYIVAVESTPPHPVTVVELDESAITAGRALYSAWWERLMACEEANIWPGYVDVAVRMTVEADCGLVVGGEDFEF